MKAYIDSFELITVLVEKSLCYPLKVFYLIDGAPTDFNVMEIPKESLNF